MGAAGSSSLSITQLEEYVQLCYLNKSEIVELFERFKRLGPEVLRDSQIRFDETRIGLEFPEIRWNPFLDRVLDVFSSKKDGMLSFEDLLDFFSALNAKCPHDVKAAWAFKIFDFDGDGQLNREDIARIIDRLLPKRTNRFTAGEFLHDDKLAIADKILLDLDLDKTGGITSSEFVHAVVKLPDFFNSFRIKV